MPLKDTWFYVSRSFVIILAIVFLLYAAEFEGVRAVYERY